MLSVCILWNLKYTFCMQRNIKLFYLFNFFCDFRFYAPIAIIYFSKVSGSYALGMSIFSITMLSAALFEVPTGVFSDYLGRKRTILIGSVFLTFAILCYALGLSYWILLVGAVAEGISRAFYSGNNNTLLYDTLKGSGQVNHYHEELGKTSSADQLALGISAVIGSIIAAKSFSLVFWLSIISPVLCVLISLFFIDPKVTKDESTNIYTHLSESFKLFIVNKKLRYLSLSGILSFGIGESAFMFRSAFIQLLWPVWAIGIAQTASNVFATLSFYFSGKLINKFNEYKLIIASGIYSFVVNLTALIFPSVASPALMSSSSLFFGTNMVAEDNLMQKAFTDHQRATMASLNSLGQSIFFGIFSIFLGMVADRVGPINALIFAVILSLPVTLLYFKSYKS